MSRYLCNISAAQTHCPTPWLGRRVPPAWHSLRRLENASLNKLVLLLLLPLPRHPLIRDFDGPWASSIHPTAFGIPTALSSCYNASDLPLKRGRILHCIPWSTCEDEVRLTLDYVLQDSIAVSRPDRRSRRRPGSCRDSHDGVVGKRGGVVESFWAFGYRGRGKRDAGGGEDGKIGVTSRLGLHRDRAAG